MYKFSIRMLASHELKLKNKCNKNLQNQLEHANRLMNNAFDFKTKVKSKRT